LRHTQVENWSRGNSVIHRRHAVVRILATFILLISIATATQHTLLACLLYLALLIAGAITAGLPPIAMLRGAATVLPFALCFAVVSALAGDPARGVMLVIRAYLSALAALLLIATTPLPDLIAGLEWLHAPRFLLQVMQFLYRYLIVLMEEAAAMRLAALARASGRLQFRQAAAAAGVLFARSHARAQSIHRAMISRGFDGRLPAFRRKPFAPSDAGFLAVASTLTLAIWATFR